MDISLVYITASDTDEAAMIGEVLVKENLVACANIINNMSSIYRWQGKICENSETVMICKTKSRLVDLIIDRVTSVHSYDCPCIIAIPVRGGNPEFLNWIDSETRQ